MRGDLGLSSAPDAVTTVLTRESRGRSERPTEEEATGRQAEPGVMWPQAKGHLEPQEWRRRGRTVPGASAGSRPADSTLDLSLRVEGGLSWRLWAARFQRPVWRVDAAPAPQTQGCPPTPGASLSALSSQPQHKLHISRGGAAQGAGPRAAVLLTSASGVADSGHPQRPRSTSRGSHSSLCPPCLCEASFCLSLGPTETAAPGRSEPQHCDTLPGVAPSAQAWSRQAAPRAQSRRQPHPASEQRPPDGLGLALGGSSPG